MNEPNIPETVTREAKIYFTVIATTHLLTMIMFAATRVRSFAPILEHNMC